MSNSATATAQVPLIPPRSPLMARGDAPAHPQVLIAVPRADGGARPIPWVSLLLSSLAVLSFLLPSLDPWLEYDRTAIAAGQLWRLLTGHWVHWSAEHLGWDLLVFAVLGVFWERCGERRRLVECVLGSALLISLGVWVVHPATDVYRGLSGIACALVTAVAVDSLRRSLGAGRRGLSLALAAALVSYFLKVGFELVTGSTVFVDTAGAPFAAVPVAHVVGGIVGMVTGLGEATRITAGSSPAGRR